MTAIHLDVVVECPDWDRLDDWHLASNLPIPTERLEYLIDRSHVTRCEYEFVDTSTVAPHAVRGDLGAVVCHRPGNDSTQPPQVPS